MSAISAEKAARLIDLMVAEMEKGEIPWLIDMDGRRYSTMHTLKEFIGDEKINRERS